MLNVDFNVPLASSSNNHIPMKTDDTLISVGDVVFVENKDPNNVDKKNFTQAIFKKSFVDINPTIFKLNV